MKQLRHNSSQMGEIGIIFMGLRADQIVKVTDFASGLSGGPIKFSFKWFQYGVDVLSCNLQS